MSTELSPAYQRHIVEKARKDARSRTQDWPGTPLSQLPLSARGDLHTMIDAGELTIVERPSVTWPGQNVAYIVATKTQETS